MTRPRWPALKKGCIALTLPGQPVDWKAPLSENASANASRLELRPNHTATAAEPSMPMVSKRRAPMRSPKVPLRNMPKA